MDEGRVIEFGGDSKQRAVIRAVNLQEFQGVGTASRVPHPQRFLLGLGMGLPEALAPHEIVARAEWLIGRCPPGRYNLIGSNCEHLANWCVTGWYFESLQVRRWFYINALATTAIMLAWQNLSPTARVRLLSVTLLTSVGPFVYQTVPYLLGRTSLSVRLM